jgi:hypothetical protein
VSKASARPLCTARSASLVRRERHDVHLRQPQFVELLVEVGHVALADRAARHGDIEAGQIFRKLRHVLGIARRNDNRFADHHVGNEIDLFLALRLDVHGGIDDIDPSPFQGRDKSVEIRIERFWLQPHMAGQDPDHLDIEPCEVTRVRVAVLERGEGRGGAIGQRALFDEPLGWGDPRIVLSGRAAGCQCPDRCSQECAFCHRQLPPSGLDPKSIFFGSTVKASWSPAVLHPGRMPEMMYVSGRGRGAATRPDACRDRASSGP